MKQLTQAVFNGAPDWVKSAAIDGNGEVWLHETTKHDMWADTMADMWGFGYDGRSQIFFDDGYDTTDWQNSAIDREVSV